MNLPNKLTIARVIAVPFFIAAYYFGWYLLAFINFGKIMDPLADKVLVYSAICLMIPMYVPAWMLIIILAREFTVAGMRTVAASEGIVIAAGMSGKIKTVLQMIAVCLLLLVPAFPFFAPLWYVAQAFLWASLIMTVYSGAEYVIKNKQVFSMK